LLAKGGAYAKLVQSLSQFKCHDRPLGVCAAEGRNSEN
jgi:hypothetical protein